MVIWTFKHLEVFKHFTSMCWTWYCGDWALYVDLCTSCTAKPTMLWMLAVWLTALILTGVISETDSTWIHLLGVYLHREWTCRLEVGTFCWCVCHVEKFSNSPMHVLPFCRLWYKHSGIRCVKAMKKCSRAHVCVVICHCKMNSHNLEQIFKFKFFPKLGGVHVKPLQCCLKH